MVKRFFIRKQQNRFCVVAILSNNEELVLDSGALPYVKARFVYYVKDRNALAKRVQELVQTNGTAGVHTA